MADRRSDTDPDGAWYEIRLQGRLSQLWAGRFEAMTVTATDDGTTVLSGRVADQAALHGLLRSLGDLAIPLLSVQRRVDADAHIDDPALPPGSAVPANPEGSST